MTHLQRNKEQVSLMRFSDNRLVHICQREYRWKRRIDIVLKSVTVLHSIAKKREVNVEPQSRRRTSTGSLHQYKLRIWSFL